MRRTLFALRSANKESDPGQIRGVRGYFLPIAFSRLWALTNFFD